MNSDHVLQYCDQIDTLVQQIRDEVTTAPEPPDPEPPDAVLVGPEDDLQAALDAGGAIAMDTGATFAHEESFMVRSSGTTLEGLGDNTVASDWHAFDVPIDVDDLTFDGFTFAGKAPEAFQLGVNGSSQTTIAQAPDRIVFRNLRSTGHRGKRAFDVNACHVEFHNCEVRDCYDPGNLDSQAICVLNAPGPVLVEGGYFEAASENLMVGGDDMKIPNCRPTGITIRNATFTKPLAWKTAGTPKVKNLIELKDGHDVVIENCDLSNSWKSAQTGYAFMCTPAEGGSVRNVLITNCRVSNVGGIVNITGTDAAGINPERTQVRIVGGEYRTSADMGGDGRFGLTTRGPEYLEIEDVIAHVHGTSFIEFGDAAHVDRFRLVGSTWNYPKYGIRIAGYNHGEDVVGVIGSIVIEGCTISGAASGFKTRYPNNTYVDAYAFGRKAETLRFGLLHGDEDES